MAIEEKATRECHLLNTAHMSELEAARLLHETANVLLNDASLLTPSRYSVDLIPLPLSLFDQTWAAPQAYHGPQ